MQKLNRGAVAAAAIILTVFSFNAGAANAAGPSSVNLGSAGNFAILTKSGISNTGSTAITGNIGVSPAAATYITGFGVGLSSDSTFSTSPIVVGKVYAADYTSPTPAMLTAAISDMQTAYTDAAGRTNPTATEVGAGNIGGLTITPGLYKWGTGVTIPADVTLTGGANDIWIFQIAGTLTVSSGVKVTLAGGAQANNVFWIVAGQTTIGTTADFSGNILDKTAVVLNTGAKLSGRALAQTAVTLDANAVTRPSAGSVAPAPVVVVAPVVVSATTSAAATSTTTTANSTTSSNSNVNSNANSSSNSSSSSHPGSTSSPVVTGTTTVTTTTTTNNGSSVSANASSFGQQVRMIAMNLGKGSNSNDVSILQNFLISQGKGPAAKALADVGATAYFGSLTRAALAEFQANAGINPSLGNFGPITRAYLSAQYK
ncbi:MAG: hypothetical protein JWO73_152 [Candidatus Taylorbacteria bacterium]|nr:hypothetical protein [Candidatus Taylorbacteria bacterium]